MASETALELQIRANSEQAIKALDKLASALGRVRTAVNNGLGLSAATDQIAKLTNAVNAAKSAGVAEYINKIAFALDRLGKSSNIRIPDLKNLKNIKDIADSVSDSKMAGNVDQAVNALAKYETAIQRVARATSGANFAKNVQASIGGEAQKLLESVGALEKAEQIFSSKFADRFSRPSTLGRASERLALPPVRLNEGNDPFSDWRDYTVSNISEMVQSSKVNLNDWKDYTVSDVNEIVRSSKSAMNDWKDSTVSNLDEMTESFRETSTAAQQTAETIQNAAQSNRQAFDNAMSGGAGGGGRGGNGGNGNPFGWAQESGMEQAGGGQAIINATSRWGEYVERVRAANTEIRNLINSIGALSNESRRSSGAVGGLISTFGRIAYYRMIRTAIKEITDGFKTGIANVREYSKAIGSEFNQAMTVANDATFKMKNSLGAALAPVLMSLIPVLQTVVSWIITAANAINQFFALLRGQSTWTRATNAAASSMNKVKSAAGGAGGAIKELLADWDELNIIQSESGGGGGGGGLGGIDYGSMFEEVDEFNEKIKAVFDKIKPIIEWIQNHLELVRGIVVLIGAAFIGWKLNSMFTGKLGRLFAIVVGLAIATHGATEAYADLEDQFKNGINWENFSKYVNDSAEAILGLGLAFGTKGIGAGLAAFGLGGIISALNDIVTKGEASKEALDQLKLSIGAEGIGLAFLTHSWIPLVIAGIAEIGIAVYENKEQIVQYIRDNINEIRTIVQDVSYAGIAIGALLAFSGVATPIGLAMMAAGFVGFATTQLDWTALSSDVDEALKQILGVVSGASLALGAILVLSGVGVGIGLGLILAGAAGLATTVDWGSFLETLKQKWDEISAWVDSSVIKPVGEWFEKLGKSIEGFMNDPIGSIERAWADVSTWFYNNVSVPVANFFVDAMNTIIDAMNWVIEKLNKIQVTIPEISAFGKTFMEEQKIGVNIDKIDRIQKLEVVNKEDVYGLLGIDQNKPIEVPVEPVLSDGFTGASTGGGRRKKPSQDNPIEVPVEPVLSDAGIDTTAVDSALSEYKAAVDETFSEPIDAPDTSNLTSGMKDAADAAVGQVNRIRQAIASLNSIRIGFGGGAITSSIIGPSFIHRAGGGMVTTGQMFMARENGMTEYIGSIGNKTGVANNDQIVSGIAGGVAQGQAEQNSLLRQQNNLLVALLNKKFEAEVKPSAGLGRVNAQSARMYERTTG